MSKRTTYKKSKKQRKSNNKTRYRKSESHSKRIKAGEIPPYHLNGTQYNPQLQDNTTLPKQSSKKGLFSAAVNVARRTSKAPSKLISYIFTPSEKLPNCKDIQPRDDIQICIKKSKEKCESNPYEEDKTRTSRYTKINDYMKSYNDLMLKCMFEVKSNKINNFTQYYKLSTDEKIKLRKDISDAAYKFGLYPNADHINKLLQP